MPRLERYADILLQYFIIRFLMSSKRFEIVGATHRAPEVSGAFLYEEDLIRKDSRVPLLALADDRLQSKLSLVLPGPSRRSRSIACAGLVVSVGFFAF